MNPARGVWWSKRTGGGREGSEAGTGAGTGPGAGPGPVERAAGAELDVGM
jgi:hypothetical protein